MNKEQITNRIAEIDALIAIVDKQNEENNRIYRKAHAEWNDLLKSYLKDAGFPVDELTTLDAERYIWRNEDENKGTARVNFRVARVNSSFTHDFYVDFHDGGCSRFSASGISASGNGFNDEIADCANYYAKVAKVLECINNQFFDSNMSLFFDTLDNFQFPETVKTPHLGSYRNEKQQLEEHLKVLELDLSVGKEVEVRDDSGSGRWARSNWYTYTVKKITSKTVVVEDHYGTRKVIKNEDVSERIRVKEPEPHRKML